MQVTKDVDVIWIDDASRPSGYSCWQISTEYCQDGKTFHEVLQDGWVELAEFNSPEFRRDPTSILEKLSKFPAEVKHFLPTRWF